MGNERKAPLKLDKEGLERIKAQIEQTQKDLNKLRNYKGTEAIFQGDNWHDNPTLYQAESEERSLMLKLRELRESLVDVEIVEKLGDSETVEIGDTVIIEMIFSEDDREEEVFRLVSANPEFGGEIQEITITSPLGASIYQKKIGDHASYKVNERQFNLLIKGKMDLSKEDDSKTLGKKL